MPGAPLSSALPPNPDPGQDRTAPAPSTRIGRLLGLVHKLITYGRDLAASVQQTAQQVAAAPTLVFLAIRFGTTDTGLILARLTRGLRRALALEAMLAQRAASGDEADDKPARKPSPRGKRGAPPAGEAPPAADRATRPNDDPRLQRLPTPRQLLAQIRRRPIGAVIVDICRDLGIAPGHVDRQLWDDLVAVLGENGSHIGELYRHMMRNLHITGDLPVTPPPALAARLQQSPPSPELVAGFLQWPAPRFNTGPP